MTTMIMRATVVLCGLIAIWLIWPAGCADDDNPVQPTPVKDFYVYFAYEQPQNKVFRYHTGTGVVDNFDLPHNLYETGFAVSPDGKTMYLYPDGFLVRVDLDSLTVTSENPIPAQHTSLGAPPEIYISPTEEYAALLHRNLYILSLSDHTIAYADTGMYYFGHFCGTGNIFLTTGFDTVGPFIMEIDLNNTASMYRKYIAGYQPGRIVANNANSLWAYLSYVDGLIWRFDVYDRNGDSSLFVEAMCPGLGDIEIAPDEKSILYSQPGSLVPTCRPPEHFTVYGTECNCIESRISTVVDSSCMVYPINDLCITPDGRHVIGSSLGGSEMFDYDLVNGTCSKIVDAGMPQPYILKCQFSE